MKRIRLGPAILDIIGDEVLITTVSDGTKRVKRTKLERLCRIYFNDYIKALYEIAISQANQNAPIYVGDYKTAKVVYNVVSKAIATNCKPISIVYKYLDNGVEQVEKFICDDGVMTLEMVYNNAWIISLKYGPEQN